MKKRFISTSIAMAVVFSIILSPAARAAQAIGMMATNIQIENALDDLEEEYTTLYGEGEKADLASSLIDSYRGDPMFLAHYQYDSEDALSMVECVVEGAIRARFSIRPLWTDGSIYGADGVPEYQQKQYNSCGAASALQVIVQQGGADNIAGSTYAEKEQTLINASYGIEEYGSVLVIEVTDFINNYRPDDELKYVYTRGLITDASTFRSLVLTSLTLDCPIILHANTRYLGYYNSHATGHYIVGTHFFAQTEEFVVNDCNDNDQYAGIHSTTMSEIYQSVHMPNSDGSSRYFIYGTYDTAGN